LTQLRWWRQNLRRCWIPSQNTTSRIHLKTTKALGTAHACGRELLGRWWWQVGPKLVIDQMVATVPGIMDDSL
jgi:hypothetical protein